MTRARIGLAFVFVLLLFPALARAENEGQSDLDKATELQLKAESLADLEKIADLCESALTKGLDEGNKQFATQLLTSTLYEHAARLSGALFNLNRIIDPKHQRHPQWKIVRELAIKDLEKATKYDEKLPAAQLLLARLYGMNPTEAAMAKAAAEKAIKLLGDEPKQKAMALIVRGSLQTEPEKQLEDFNEAVKTAPDSVDAHRARALYYVLKKDFAKATEDFAKILELNPEDTEALSELADSLTAEKKFDEAIKLIDRVIEANPKAPLGYTARARIKTLQGNTESALEDLNKAIELEPRDVTALMVRAAVYSQMKEFAKAKADVDAALKIRPNMVQGILMQAELAAQKGNYEEALQNMRLMANADPMNPLWKVQIAQLLSADKRPRAAIEVATEVIKMDEANPNASALRVRGDAYLSIGKHKEAVADLEASLKEDPKNSGVLNNLAWVLATSPEDDVRNGKRAIELATQACEVTDYKRPHVLSTLAAAYAESGDFENAVKWSTKAVELSTEGENKPDPEVQEQLKKELEGFQNKKPFREKQETPEKEVKPQLPREDLEI